MTVKRQESSTCNAVSTGRNSTSQVITDHAWSKPHYTQQLQQGVNKAVVVATRCAAEGEGSPIDTHRAGGNSDVHTKHVSDVPTQSCIGVRETLASEIRTI